MNAVGLEPAGELLRLAEGDEVPTRRGVGRDAGHIARHRLNAGAVVLVRSATTAVY